jgi:hypothetical protein
MDPCRSRYILKDVLRSFHICTSSYCNMLRRTCRRIQEQIMSLRTIPDRVPSLSFSLLSIRTTQQHNNTIEKQYCYLRQNFLQQYIEHYSSEPTHGFVSSIIPLNHFCSTRKGLFPSASATYTYPTTLSKDYRGTKMQTIWYTICCTTMAQISRLQCRFGLIIAHQGTEPSGPPPPSFPDNGLLTGSLISFGFLKIVQNQTLWLVQSLTWSSTSSSWQVRV